MTLPRQAYKPFLAVLALAMLFSVSVTQGRLNAERKRLGLTREDDPLKNAPPVLAFITVALGSFRGLIANALWIRATDLQENDKFFEMVQLADWITKLQPQNTTVWVHMAWNMSYNISVKFTEASDRWNWVRRGIELLRDEGLKYAGKEPLIYRELAWHFQHKMGDNLDDAHNYYKKVWAAEMAAVLGRGKPDWNELLNPQTPTAAERVRVLREKYKMDPRLMKEVDDTYGPLEWRLPESHALYWGMAGLKATSADKLKKEDMIQIRRVVFHSMQLAFRRGRILRDTPELIYGPNLDVVRQASKAYEDMIDAEPDKREHIGGGHKNFLLTAVYFLYTHNRIKEAGEWFRLTRERYPNAVPPEQSLDEFALSKVSEDIGETSHDRVKAILLGLLNNSFLSQAMGNPDEAGGYLLFARKAHSRFQDEIGKLDATNVRIGLPPLEQLRQEALADLLNPDTGLRPEFAAQLRTALGLAAGTNVPGGITGRPTNAPLTEGGKR